MSIFFGWMRNLLKRSGKNNESIPIVLLARPENNNSDSGYFENIGNR